MTFTSDNPNVLKVFPKKISSLGNIFLKAFTTQILLQKRPFEHPKPFETQNCWVFFLSSNYTDVYLLIFYFSWPMRFCFTYFE